MTTKVIQADSLGKEYRRGLGASSGLLRDALARAIHSPASLFRRERAEKFWALRNVSLEVNEGEVLGLIGRNGSGKTTLLKILSRITRPTEGWAEIHGRVGSLLEVGTGFHPELTGRENTYLSGAILGMSKKEISRKFDEIVAFSELEKFIDTPVKHYSSGMYVRLAFAVAAHLEPEILLVDEVLSVGDINFQKKCLGKMGEVAGAGLTVVLVSHQLNQIRRLSQRVVWVDAGEIRKSGAASEVVSAYEAAMSAGDHSTTSRAKNFADKARFLRWEVTAPQGRSPHTLQTLGPCVIRFLLEVQGSLRHAHHGIALYNTDRQLLWGYGTDDIDLQLGLHEVVYEFPALPLRPGIYSWLVTLWDDSGLVDQWEGVPEMLVDTPSHMHARDEWGGILNIPMAVKVNSRFDLCVSNPVSDIGVSGNTRTPPDPETHRKDV
jgi:ABC-type polysaccharide/polyol phosphate transport system ATPase subunit